MNAVVQINTDAGSSPSERIPFLDSLRAMAMFMVVGVHTLGYTLPLPEAQKRTILFIVQISVPLFFFVDGYLFARNTISLKKYDYINNVRKSFFRLLVPWTIFTLFYTIVRYCFEMTGHIREKLIMGHSLLEVAISAYGSVYAPQMYFLASLFLIRLCAPVFKRIALVSSYSSLLVLLFCYYAVYEACIPSLTPSLTIDEGREPVLHALWGSQYYLAGIVLFRTSEILRLQNLFVPFLVFFLVAAFLSDGTGRLGLILVQNVYLITVFLFFLLLGDRLPLLDMIGRNTMGIYLLHAPIVVKGVSLVLNSFISVPLLSFLSILLCSFVLTLCIVIAVTYVPYGVVFFGTPYRRNRPLSADKQLSRTHQDGIS